MTTEAMQKVLDKMSEGSRMTYGDEKLYCDDRDIMAIFICDLAKWLDKEWPSCCYRNPNLVVDGWEEDMERVIKKWAMQMEELGQ
jgi:hypothetical protein